MGESFGKLTVFFEDPFWVGVFERIEDGRLSACKVTFGAEPKDDEIWDFVLKNYHRLKYSPSVEAAVKEKLTNPKRVQRELRKQSAYSGVGTKSQQALQLQREENKLERKTINREQREAEKQRQFELRQQKRKEKRRGRECPGDRMTGEMPGLWAAVPETPVCGILSLFFKKSVDKPGVGCYTTNAQQSRKVPPPHRRPEGRSVNMVGLPYHRGRVCVCVGYLSRYPFYFAWEVLSYQ